MSAITVRQAVLADLDVLTGLFDDYRQFQGQPGDRPAARRFLRARFDHGESLVFIAHEAADAVGLAQLYPSDSSVSLARVFVVNDLFVAARPGAAAWLRSCWLLCRPMPGRSTLRA